MQLNTSLDTRLCLASEPILAIKFSHSLTSLFITVQNKFCNVIVIKAFIAIDSRGDSVFGF